MGIEAKCDGNFLLADLFEHSSVDFSSQSLAIDNLHNKNHVTFKTYHRGAMDINDKLSSLCFFVSGALASALRERKRIKLD
jgi:hypothetical protein